jgi:hypothetical protein
MPAKEMSSSTLWQLKLPFIHTSAHHFIFVDDVDMTLMVSPGRHSPTELEGISF